MYEEIQLKIYQMSIEISSGMYTINNGTHDYEDVTNEYIKRSILDGLKKRALALIEDEVILEFMISERQEQLELLKQELIAMESNVNEQ